MSEDQAGAVVNSTGNKPLSNADLELLQMETQAHSKALRTDLKALQTAMRADLKADLLDFQVKFMATQVAVASLIVAVIKLL